MHLLHRDNLTVVNTDGRLHIAHVLADDLVIVADAVGNVKPGIAPDALAAAPTHEAMQQTSVLLPLGDG
jgi:hypothetical protein